MNMNTMPNSSTMRRMNDMAPHSGGSVMNRRQLMDHINQVSCAGDEVKLYLDAHPCDR